MPVPFLQIKKKPSIDTYIDFIKAIASVLCLCLNLNYIDCFLVYHITGNYIYSSRFCKLSAKQENKNASSKYLKYFIKYLLNKNRYRT